MGIHKILPLQTLMMYGAIAIGVVACAPENVKRHSEVTAEDCERFPTRGCVTHAYIEPGEVTKDTESTAEGGRYVFRAEKTFKTLRYNMTYDFTVDIYPDEKARWDIPRGLITQIFPLCSGFGCANAGELPVLSINHGGENDLTILLFAPCGDCEDETTLNLVAGERVGGRIFRLGEWNRFDYKIRLSQIDGIFRLSINGREVINYTGPFGAQGEKALFKIGVYDPANSKTTAERKKEGPFSMYIDF